MGSLKTFRGVLCALLILGFGCKKPEVEVEEEGPPLPLPMEGQQPNQPNSAGDMPANPAVSGSGPGLGKDAPPMEALCAQIDAHMNFVGVKTSELRDCGRLEPGTDTIRVVDYGYRLPGNPDTFVGIYNVCFWPKEVGDGWEVGYIDQRWQECETRDTYCRLGVEHSLMELSVKACPGDREHHLVQPAATLASLSGSWSAANGDFATFNVDKRALWKSGDVTYTGRFELTSSVTMDFWFKPNERFTLFYALQGETLHLSREPIAPAVDPGAFRMLANGRTWVRRFRGGCYQIDPKPRDVPLPLECPIEGEGQAATVSVVVDGLDYSLVRSGPFWLPGQIAPITFTRGEPGATPEVQEANPEGEKAEKTSAPPQGEAPKPKTKTKTKSDAKSAPGP